MLRFKHLLLCLFAAFFGFAASPVLAATCSPAGSQGTAPATWQTYCWLDLASYSDATANSAAGQNFSFVLSDGATLAFNLKRTGTGPVAARAAPSWGGAAVGNSAFLTIPGSPIMYQTANGTTSILTISAITITPPAGVSAVSAYSFVVADAESTDGAETLNYVTNGSNWVILDNVPPISGAQYPTNSGAGTTSFTSTGGGLGGNVGAYIVGTNSPTTVTSTMVGSGLQGIMFAVRFASLRLNKQIVGARVDPADQFTFDIRATSASPAAAPMATGTSTGTSLGPFTAAAISLASGIPLTISEKMASGSASLMSQYQSKLTCINGVSGSSTVLPTNVATTSYSFGTLQFGDAIQCSFTNTPYPHLKLGKALAINRIVAADQFVMAIKSGSTSIATATTTGTGSTIATGATAMTQVTAGTVYGFSESGAGSTDILPYLKTISCTNANAASTTVLPTEFPANVTPAIGDVITCILTNGRALLTLTKSSTINSDPVNGTINPKFLPGAELTYSLAVSNRGSSRTTSNTIFMLDPLPSTTTFKVGTVAFTNGTPTSGLTAWNAATDVRYSNASSVPANFAACTYTPSGTYDANVRYICLNPKGRMDAASGTNYPNFTITFRVRVN